MFEGWIGRMGEALGIGLTKNIDKELDKVIPVIGTTVETVGEVAKSAASVASSATTVITADANVQISEDSTLAALAKESWLAANARPMISIVLTAVIILKSLGWIHITLDPVEMGYIFTLLGVHVGGRSLEKIASAIANRR